ncbi:MAG: hypothetical protein KGL01_04165 [Betaproteobacteria bacterium]|nr:hypothetical protein [Betaproteobacteria bacterium]
MKDTFKVCAMHKRFVLTILSRFAAKSSKPQCTGPTGKDELMGNSFYIFGE